MASRRRAAKGIRWDRVGRVALLVVLAGVLALYVNPARTYLSTRSEAATKTDDLRRLQAENRRLRARRAELRDPAALEREARRLGFIKPGERAYAIEGLPAR